MIIWWLHLQLPLQLVPITTKVENSNPTQGEVYLTQLYVIKFVSDMRQPGGFLRGHGGFLWGLRFPPRIKQTATIYC